MLPKSLHTVRVLSTVARMLRGMDRDAGRPVLTDAAYVDCAALVLAYGADCPDPHGLKARAAAAMVRA